MCNSPFIVKHGTTPMGINEVLLQPLILLFLKTLSSCSFDMLQSKHRGATCHTFLFLLSNSLYFHLRRSFHIKARSTYFRPKTTNRNIHSFLFYHNISRYDQLILHYRCSNYIHLPLSTFSSLEYIYLRSFSITAS